MSSDRPYAFRGRMQRVAIAGVSGHLGERLTSALEQAFPHGFLLGLDEHPPHQSSSLVFFRHSLRTSFCHFILEHWIDTLIYLAPVSEPGAVQVLREALHWGNLQRLVLVQQAEQPLHIEPHPDTTEAVSEAQAERLRAPAQGTDPTDWSGLGSDFLEEHPEVSVVKVWVPPLVAPGWAQGWRRGLWAPVVWLPRGPARMRVCHLDNAVEALLALARSDVRGPVDIGPDQGLSWLDLTRTLRRPVLPVPGSLIRLLAHRDPLPEAQAGHAPDWRALRALLQPQPPTKPVEAVLSFRHQI